MAGILADIHALAQHIIQLSVNPEQYRPNCCPHCGSAKLHCHGTYPRKPDRVNHSEDSLNPIMIPRFRCVFNQCRKTSSVLPQCIAPRRWYLWSEQQAMLVLLLANKLNMDQSKPHVRTIWRWWTRLKASFDLHRYHLCEQDASLGQYTNVSDFWKACFLKYTLSQLMLILHRQNICVP